MSRSVEYKVRPVSPPDIAGVIALCGRVYPNSPTWSEAQIQSHLSLFPDGQMVAYDVTDRVVGYCASLIVYWDEYDLSGSWRDFTQGGFFTNHDPKRGRTLYGAEIMVSPESQGQGIGTLLYEARERLCRRLRLLRIRAGARLRDYCLHADKLSPPEYVTRVVRGELVDRTLTFQLKRGFQVLSVVQGYLRHDPESLGNAAVIEWLNPGVATPEDRQRQAASPYWKAPDRA